MMKKAAVAFAVLGLMLAIAPEAKAQCVASDDASGTQCYTLYAGQSIDAGTVCATVIGDNLEVTYATINGWQLDETHLWVGASSGDMPQTRKGNPIPGRFPYNSGDLNGATDYSVSVPLSGLGFSCPSADQAFLMAAHASVYRDNGDGTTQTETGWSDGSPITSRGSWATMSTITLTCDCDSTPPGPSECETAFAYAADATCFLDIDEDGDGARDFSRWGWTIGPLAEGSYSYDIYAGAGRCDITKGEFVGTLSVEYFNGEATVTYDLVAPYTTNETHLYVGNLLLPTNNGYFTVAPGQYPTIHDELLGVASDSYTVSASGDIYVVAHSTVCGF